MSGLTHLRVIATVREIGLTWDADPHGVHVDAEHRLERGSGIAGRGGAWRIVIKRTGESWGNMPFVDTLKELRWWLRAFMTGAQPPPPRDGFRAVPRLNRNRFGEAWVWSWVKTG